VLTQFIGGQGLVVMFISVFAAGAGAVGMYAGEAREDRILPNLRRTANFIWRVSLGYLAMGTAALWAALVAADMPAWKGLFHAVMLFIAGFDTGGFTPTSASVGLYHSWAVELVASVTMVAGALSFALHYQLWSGRPRELLRNVETRLLTATLLGTFSLVALGLVQSGTYHSAVVVLRRGLFHALSAHTGTGFNTLPVPLFATDWGALAPGALVIAMALGGMAGSTSGGIKSIRLALVGKHMRRELRLMLLPPDAYAIETYHSNGSQVVRPAAVRSALMILLLFLLLDLLGALAGLYYGYSFDLAMFESTSAANNVGLSVGIAGPGAEAPLTLVYTLQMWIGRLEFVAVLALVGFVVSSLRGRP
ncbi:MAG: TrkH family potassium uptake protein, partial [Actinobacteria bacterium]|nr:TrkH family potassium uptake protein [Actinomycetota bacterium]